LLSIANEHTRADTQVRYIGPNNLVVDLTACCRAGPRELAEPTLLLYGDIGLTGYELHVWRVHVAVLFLKSSCRGNTLSNGVTWHFEMPRGFVLDKDLLTLFNTTMQCTLN